VSASPEVSVLFVCLGNICRSPTAEGVLRARLVQAGLDGRVHVDSAGTGSWHVGHPPDPRAIEAAARRGIDLTALRARRVTREDLEHFDYVLAMDGANLRDLERLAPGRARRFLEFAEGVDVGDVLDPYYGDGDGFARVLDLVEAAADGLLEEIRARVEGR
jgi:protein-tyrosine phosphatase